MRTACCLALLAALSAGPAATQVQPDYLTAEEIEQAREIQEPNKRIELFLGFCELRLAAFEQAVREAEALRPYEVRDKLNDFTRAVDDTTDVVARAVERGGTELKKAREKAKLKVQDFAKRLEAIRQTEVIQSDEDLGFDVGDAVEAVTDLTETAKAIPDGILPAKALPTEEAARDEKEAAPGKPTLKRRDDKPKQDKPKN